MDHDEQAESTTVDTDVTIDTGDTDVTETELADELLIEEISIDGMCGVY